VGKKKRWFSSPYSDTGVNRKKHQGDHIPRRRGRGSVSIKASGSGHRKISSQQRRDLMGGPGANRKKMHATYKAQCLGRLRKAGSEGKVRHARRGSKEGNGGQRGGEVDDPGTMGSLTGSMRNYLQSREKGTFEG